MAKKTFDVTVTRTTYSIHTFKIEADTVQEAESQAVTDAGNFDGWDTGNAEYEIEHTEQKRKRKK